MTAFDYATQKWVEGDEAIALRGHQLTEELALLRSAHGPAYARFIGIESIPDAVASLENQLEEVIIALAEGVPMRKMRRNDAINLPVGCTIELCGMTSVYRFFHDGSYRKILEACAHNKTLPSLAQIRNAFGDPVKITTDFQKEGL